MYTSARNADTYAGMQSSFFNNVFFWEYLPRYFTNSCLIYLSLKDWTACASKIIRT